MRFVVASFCSVVLFSIGCGDSAETPPNTFASAPPALNAPAPPEQAGDATPPAAVAAAVPPMNASAAPGVVIASATAPEGFTPVALPAGVAKLGPENATIQFVGKHVQPDGSENDPRARTGIFEKFTAQVEFDPATKTLKSAQAEIDTTSLWVPQDGLRDHLQNPDFLDVRTHPTIKFESTQIEPGTEQGIVNITGNLTLHGVTKPITFPSKVSLSEAGTTIDSELVLDRTEFGMDRLLDRVIPKVQLRVMVGKPTERPQAAEGGGRRRRGGGGG
jgi:polyisoprenoid-binding protein YceI